MSDGLSPSLSLSLSISLSLSLFSLTQSSCLFLSFLLQRDVPLGLLFLGFPLLLLVEEEGALVGLTAGAGVFDWSIPG